MGRAYMIQKDQVSAVGRVMTFSAVGIGCVGVLDVLQGGAGPVNCHGEVEGPLDDVLARIGGYEVETDGLPRLSPSLQLVVYASQRRGNDKQYFLIAWEPL